MPWVAHAKVGEVAAARRGQRDDQDCRSDRPSAVLTKQGWRLEAGEPEQPPGCESVEDQSAQQRKAGDDDAKCVEVQHDEGGRVDGEYAEGREDAQCQKDVLANPAARTLVSGRSRRLVRRRRRRRCRKSGRKSTSAPRSGCGP